MDFARRKPALKGIDITPMVDIVFQLLIFFILSSNYISPALKMELPKAMFREKLEKVDIIVTAGPRGELFVNREEVAVDDLKGILQERMTRMGKYDVIFKGDTTIPYGRFVEVLDIAKLAGATSFSVEHDKKR
ncbi:MAG: biopolymer transporter ExbD [Spirochaetes bacterium]|nr:biopolymer transporter ExbD [Spirochaetota bacterium]